MQLQALALLLFFVANVSADISSFPLVSKPSVSADGMRSRRRRGDESCRLTSSVSSSGQLLKIRGGSSGDGVDWRYFVAGGLCAATSHGITTPIDVIKTRMQQMPGKYTKGVLAAAKDIVAAEGAGFLLAGLGPTVIGYGLEGALKFGVYESCKKLFATVTIHQFINFLLASVVAGAVASIVLCPMEEARIKMVGDKSWAHENTLSGILRLAREGGILSTFSGLPAMLSKQVPYTMSKQVSFDLFAKFFYGLAAHLALKGDLKWFISIASAFCASVLACLGSQPGDMILTATYEGHGGSNDIFSIIRSIYNKHGLGGFYFGLQARLMHVASIITSQLVLYDIIKLALGLPATGSGH